MYHLLTSHSCSSQLTAQSYITTDGQSASLSWCQAFIWGPRPDFLLPSDSCGFVDVGRPLWREGGSVVYNCETSPGQSFSRPSPAGPVNIFYCLKFETPPTWKARSIYWFIYPRNRVVQLHTPRHWVPFSSPPSTLRATVEVFEPASTRDQPQINYQSSLYDPGTDISQNFSSIIACSLVVGETTCPQSCSLATAVVLSLVYTAVSWQWIYMSQQLWRQARSWVDKLTEEKSV
jgi:hypothetical protein